MKLSGHCIEEQEDDIPEEELKSLEEQTEFEKESVATLTVGSMLGYIYFFQKPDRQNVENNAASS